MSRTTILDATERLMVEEGYAAVSTRRVATKAGLKAPLVHYYYKTTDDLLIALYERQAERAQETLQKGLASEHPLRAIWSFYREGGHTALALEFMALANHRKAIRTEIARRAERFRKQQADAVAGALGRSTIGSGARVPEALTQCITAVALSLVMEEGLGMSFGHQDADGMVDWLIRLLESLPGEASPEAVARLVIAQKA